MSNFVLYWFCCFIVVPEPFTRMYGSGFDLLPEVEWARERHQSQLVKEERTSEDEQHPVIDGPVAAEELGGQ